MSDCLTDIDGDTLFDIESERDFHVPLRQYIKGLESLKETNTQLATENNQLRKRTELMKENAGLKMAFVLNSILSACDDKTKDSILKSYIGNGKNGAEKQLQRAEETPSPTQCFDTSGSEKYLYSINKSDAIVPPFQSNYSPAKAISPLPTSRRLFDPVLDSYRTSDMKTITSTVNNGGNKTEATISRSQTKYIRDDGSDISSPRIHESSIKSNYSTVKTDAANPASYKRDTTARSNYSYTKDDPLEARRETNTITNYSTTKDHPDDYQHDSGSTSSFSFTKDSLDDPSSYKHETSSRSNYAAIKGHPGGYKHDSSFTSNYATARKGKNEETTSKSNYTTYNFNNGKPETKLTTQGPSTSTYFSKFSSKLDKSAKYTPKASGTSLKSGDISVSSIGQPVATSTPIAARPDKDKGKSPKFTSKRMDTTTTSHNKSKTTEGAGAGQASTSITTTTTTRVFQSDFVIRPSRRMIGEIAYQLDRRILNYVFLSNSKSGVNRRFYGYVVGNLPEKILRESVNNKTGHVDENKLFVLQHRLDAILNSLRPLGYDIEHHSAFTADMVNKYGLLPPPPKERQVTIGKERKAEIIEIIVKVADPGEVKDMLIVLECLALFANDDGKPFIIW